MIGLTLDKPVTKGKGEKDKDKAGLELNWNIAIIGQGRIRRVRGSSKVSTKGTFWRLDEDMDMGR